jgi:peptide/nickel transport system substrate-binding protein
LIGLGDQDVSPRVLSLLLLLNWCLLDAAVVVRPEAPTQAASQEELLVVAGAVGQRGGELVVTQRAEPRTLNPVTAADAPSREVIRRTIGDLIHINRETHEVEPALARSWSVSPDGRRLTLSLRRGVRFSDGDPFDADDVVFSFRVYLDEKIASPQRDLLLVGGKPIAVRKVDQYTVEFGLAAPYSVAERIFDSLAMLPRHLLERAYAEGRLAEAWSLATPATQVAGLGPFRFREHVGGQRVVLERNPYYWKSNTAGERLPYLDRLIFLPVASEDAQVLRFQAGEADLLNRIGAESFGALAREQEARGYVVQDLGPSLEYTFLFFNMNDLPAEQAALARKQRWFRDTTFRQAVSAAIDRESIVRGVYRGRATPLAGHVTPGNKRWVNAKLIAPVHSPARARDLLTKAGYRAGSDQVLRDPAGERVEFSILVNASNPILKEAATMIQEDLRQIGIRAHVAPLEFRAMVDRVLNTREYEAAVLALGGGDADPNAELNVWLSSGPQHLWRVGAAQPATAWEAEIDTLMRAQVGMLDRESRKRAYDRVQAIVAEQVPFVCLVSPNVLVGAREGLANVRPVVMDHQLLWNIEELFWRAPSSRRSR